MDQSYKPNGYSTVSPYLVVEGASDTIDFLERVFGAVELRRFPDAAGKLLHAEVRIDDTVVMIADGGESWPPVPSYVHVYVSDVDALHERAKAAGAEVTGLETSPIGDVAYGDGSRGSGLGLRAARRRP